MQAAPVSGFELKPWLITVLLVAGGAPALWLWHDSTSSIIEPPGIDDEPGTGPGDGEHFVRNVVILMAFNVVTGFVAMVGVRRAIRFYTVAAMAAIEMAVQLGYSWVYLRGIKGVPGSPEMAGPLGDLVALALASVFYVPAVFVSAGLGGLVDVIVTALVRRPRGAALNWSAPQWPPPSTGSETSN